MLPTHRSFSRNTVETVIVLLLLLALFVAVYDVLRVFFGVFTFAIIFAVSLAQPFERLCRRTGQRRTLAAIIYSILLLAIVALPFILIISALGKHASQLLSFAGEVREHGLPPLPGNISSLPVVGNGIAEFWQHLRDNPREALVGHDRQINLLLHRLLTGGAGIAGATLQCVLGILVSAMLLAAGPKTLLPLKNILRHLLGRSDAQTLIQASLSAIRGVSIGVMGTAFIASALSYIGFAIAGLHFKMLFTAIVFFLVLIQVGPLLVWLPLVIWAAMQGHTGLAVFLAVYGGFVLAADAILKPILIAKSGGRLPFLVLFTGVVGGLAAWGFTGMFKGAIILSVAYTLYDSWLERKRQHNGPGRLPSTGT
ncbi:AI-2E family transporter [Chitinophaga sp. NPDC101104]|uniref:AI-2E family transporter n=1 Tax=Chitinophaga sp. NPDC101104 TaxID=3390561 RepID=UPI003D066C0F